MDHGIARIYQPARTAMQSGRGNTRRWRLEFEPRAARGIEPLMGWTSSTDMDQQLSLRFDSRDDAVAFCRRHGIPYRLMEPHERQIRPKSYAENFRYDRVR